jgi:hypothetical protein
MGVTNLYFKVELEHDSDENPVRIAGEIRRQLLRFYGVREVEVSNIAAVEDNGADE